MGDAGPPLSEWPSPALRLLRLLLLPLAVLDAPEPATAAATAGTSVCKAATAACKTATAAASWTSAFILSILAASCAASVEMRSSTSAIFLDGLFID